MTELQSIPEDSQTSLERVMCYLQGQKPQRIACFPLILNYAARVLGVPIGEYNRNADLMGKSHIAAYKRYGNDLVTIFSTTTNLLKGTPEQIDEEAGSYVKRPWTARAASFWDPDARSLLTPPVKTWTPLSKPPESTAGSTPDRRKAAAWHIHR